MSDALSHLRDGEGRCTDRSGRCAYGPGHFGEHSYEPHRPISVAPAPAGLGDRFFARAPLSMDSLKGPDEQYRAGARDMLFCAVELLREQTALTITGPHQAADLLELELGS